MNQQIEINPQILVGKAIIKGTRIPVYLILNLVAHGYSFERIIQAYPELTKGNIRAALEYAEKMTKYEEELTPHITHA